MAGSSVGLGREARGTDPLYAGSGRWRPTTGSHGEGGPFLFLAHPVLVAVPGRKPGVDLSFP